MRIPTVSPTRKGFLIGRFVTLLIGTDVIFPIQYGRARFIDELVVSMLFGHGGDWLYELTE